MTNKAVFVDRDRTLMDDPGYVTAPSAVKLLPGVETAIKSLSSVGYRVIVVTNQAGVARGLFGIEALEGLHAELRRQLAERGAHLDGIYYCPYHPEGAVEEFTRDSDLRKPKPGMLLKAAEDFGLDLSQSWMVGDGPADVEAGQRAGCRTIRVRMPGVPPPAEETDENAQADFTVRNLVDAARIITREMQEAAPSSPAVAPTLAPAPAGRPLSAEDRPVAELDDSEVRREILRYVRRLARSQELQEFTFTKMIAGVVQVLALLVLLLAFWRAVAGDIPGAQLWATFAAALQVMTLTFFMMHRNL